MARGRVVTPNDGIGLRLLPGSQTLARNIQWAVPQYMHNGDGQWSAVLLSPLLILRDRCGELT